MASRLQKLSRDRSHFKWRISGMVIPVKGLTDFEREIVEEINVKIKLLKDNFVEQSRVLGLDAKHRCSCGKVVENKGDSCKIHTWDE